MLTCIPGILNSSDLERIDGILKDAEFEDGRATAGFRAKRVKENLQLNSAAPRKKEVNELVENALKRSTLFRRVAIPRIICPPLISRYKPGMAYGAHVDDALMGSDRRVRTDLAVTVFLNEQSEYEGGELMISTSMGDIAVKLPRGDGVVYPASTIHRVNPIVSGERIAAVTWVQSHVREPMQRELLADLDLLKNSLNDVNPNDEKTDIAFKIYSNLLRMWADA
ncbi:MAG: Fe2+-dependent dioxygenase [Gammaproteobacteria bacterium]|nr:Fe2+-dependent dioxygenase [Gammaproteobacteria bacterium]